MKKHHIMKTLCVAATMLTICSSNEESSEIIGNFIARTPSLEEPFYSDSSLALAATIVGGADTAVSAAIGVVVSRKGVPPTVVLLASGNPLGPRAVERLVFLAPDVSLRTVVARNHSERGSIGDGGEDDIEEEEEEEEDAGAQALQARRVIEHMNPAGQQRNNNDKYSQKCVLWLHSALEAGAARDAAAAAVAATASFTPSSSSSPSLSMRQKTDEATEAEERGAKKWNEKKEDDSCGGAGFGGGVLRALPAAFSAAFASSSNRSSSSAPPQLLVHEKGVRLAARGAHWRCNGALLLSGNGRYRFALPWRVCDPPCATETNLQRGNAPPPLPRQEQGQQQQQQQQQPSRARKKVGYSVDVVIPAHPKDALVLKACVVAARRHVVGVRRVLVVSRARPLLGLEAETRLQQGEGGGGGGLGGGRGGLWAEWVPEANYPFSLQDVAEALPQSWAATPTTNTHVDKGGQSAGGGSRDGTLAEELVPNEKRAGWYFQQLLKLYAHQAIPGLSEHYLILDADVILMRDTLFFALAATTATTANTATAAAAAAAAAMTAATTTTEEKRGKASSPSSPSSSPLQKEEKGKREGWEEEEEGEGEEEEEEAAVAVVLVPLLTAATEFNRPFFAHAQHLFNTRSSDFRRVHPLMSGVAHHMPLVRSHVEELLAFVEEGREGGGGGGGGGGSGGRRDGTPFWRQFLHAAVVTSSWYGEDKGVGDGGGDGGDGLHELRSGEYPGASEFEILFNWILSAGSVDFHGGDSSRGGGKRGRRSSTDQCGSGSTDGSDGSGAGSCEQEQAATAAAPMVGAVRQLDWCNARTWAGSGETLVRALAAILDTDGGYNDDDGGVVAYDVGALAASTDPRFAPFDFLALHHHQRGEAAGCDAQYCGCCGV